MTPLDQLRAACPYAYRRGLESAINCLPQEDEWPEDLRVREFPK